MKKKRSHEARPRSRPASPESANPPPKSRRRWIAGTLIVSLLAGAGIWAAFHFNSSPQSKPEGPYVPRPANTLTFSRDIAPIVFQHCSPCHRPGQSAPFSLLTFTDVSKHAKDIADVTAKRFMPPWLAEPGYGEFVNARLLSATDLGLLQQWIAEGAVEGNAAHLPPAPNWESGWQLGQPDLVVRLPEPYLLPAEGKDVYRNLVLPIPLNGRRYVKAVDFHPGNPKVVHHAAFAIDLTGESRRLAVRQNSTGFDGMELPESASMVAGQLLGWEPGKQPDVSGDGLGWPLDKNNDLVVQLHLHPSGKPEPVQPEVAFYFTDQSPTNTPFLIRLPQWQIDIPPGAANYAVENSYVLPVDLEALRISPHAHYLAKEMQAYAMLPDGTKRWLLLIKQWDFNWQGDYHYAAPVFLPKGTKLVMHFTYDNSAENPRNPSHPPRRVRQGPQTTDEMGQITLQVLPRNAADRATLAADHFKKLTLDSIAYNLSVLQENPNDARTHAKLGQSLLPLGRFAEAFEHLTAAIRLDPNDDKPHYDLGTLYLARNELEPARLELETVLRLNPNDYQAYGNLGSIYQRAGDYDRAILNFENAVRLNPDDMIAKRSLDAVLAQKRAAARGK